MKPEFSVMPYTDLLTFVRNLETQHRFTNTQCGRTAADFVAEELDITVREGLTLLNEMHEFDRTGTLLCPTCKGSGKVRT